MYVLFKTLSTDNLQQPVPRCLLPAQQPRSLEPKNTFFIEKIQTILFDTIAQRHEKKMGACLLFDGRDYFSVFVRVLSSSSLSTITIRSTNNTFNYLCEVVATGHATRYYSEKEHEILGKC